MATLKDIAAESKLTVTTVSRILNNRGYISNEARRKVDEAIKKLNYQPNEVARSLSVRKTNIIGIIVPNIHKPYFASLISSLEEQANLYDKKIYLFNSKEELEKEKQYLQICRGNRVEGIILCGPVQEMEGIYNNSVQIITIGQNTADVKTSIESDSLLEGTLAAEHLIKKGCSNLIYFNDADCDETMAANLGAVGFSNTCLKHQVHYKMISAKKIQDENHDFIEAFKQILEDNPDTDGIFTNSDIFSAPLVLQGCHKLNIDVPHKMKIIGLDDEYISALMTPRITIIQRPVEKMAKAALECLVNASEGMVVPARIVFPVSIMIRETT